MGGRAGGKARKQPDGRLERGGQKNGENCPGSGKNRNMAGKSADFTALSLAMPPPSLYKGAV